jgi:hypothetical protein
MEKVKNIADELANLRIITDVPNFADVRQPHLLRFRCITCERGVDPFTFEKRAIERLGGAWLDSPLEGMVRSGRYALIDFDNHRCAVVLPFDIRRWSGHLLHDVRAEWDRQFICARGVSVQTWPDVIGSRMIEIIGETRRCPTAKRLRELDVSVLRRSALVRVLSTQQYFCWIPESLVTDDGILVLKSEHAPEVGRFVLDTKDWSPSDADAEVDAL